ncbi:MAG: sigma-70 family RNA polymerase sigma factor [Steroidobacteraceae bacterium]
MNDTSLAEFEAQRPRLRRLAYRMLGSFAEADDIVQDAWLRWQRADPREVVNVAAFLRQTVTHLCLDVLKSARTRRESYVGQWLPEPLAEAESEAPRSDDLTLTLMLALERLSPLERAAFLLHDVFDVPLQEVATTLHRDAAAVRQLAVRARKHVSDARPRFAVAREEGERLARAFFDASTTGDVDRLQGLLAADAVIRSDGGGKVPAFRKPLIGRDRILRMYAGFARKTKGPALFVRRAWIDGLPGYVSRNADGHLQTVALQIEGGLVTAIYVTRNPDKLRNLPAALMDGAVRD